jgi:hypothetical protein
MRGTKKGIVLAPFLVVFASLAFAEPSYLIYPNAPAVFRFDANRFELVLPGDPKFDSNFAVGNQMLWDRVEGRVPVEIYRAPSLLGFEPSVKGQSEFYVVSTDFEIVVDGFGPMQRTIGGLCVRFWPSPAHVQLTIDGSLATGLTHNLDALEVMTAVGGGYYADTARFMLSWIGAREIRVVAFSDKDGDRAFDGTALYSIVARNETVSTFPTTWGQIKSLYR